MKKGFDKDISPATISSWIKQTVILCYELSDQESLILHQVKAHDVRAFAAFKAFSVRGLLDQILSACHLGSAQYWDRPACGGIMYSYKITFSVVWRAGIR